MENKKIITELKECVDIGNADVVSDTIACGELKYLQLRDILMQVGTIMKENTQDSIYVMKAKRGLFGKTVYLSMRLSDNKLQLCGFAYKGKSSVLYH